MKAFAFKWKSNNPLGSGAIVAAPNQTTACRILNSLFCKKNISFIEVEQIDAGPFWARRAKIVKEAQILYFRHLGKRNEVQ